MKFDYGSYGYIALRDLEDARNSVSTMPRLSVLASHGAVEKILKQYARVQGIDSEHPEIMKSHKPATMVSKLGLPALIDERPALFEFGDLYYDTRYPSNDFFEATVEDSRRILATAERVVQIVLDALVTSPEDMGDVELPRSTINRMKLD